MRSAAPNSGPPGRWVKKIESAFSHSLLPCPAVPFPKACGTAAGCRFNDLVHIYIPLQQDSVRSPSLSGKVLLGACGFLMILRLPSLDLRGFGVFLPLSEHRGLRLLAGVATHSFPNFHIEYIILYWVCQEVLRKNLQLFSRRLASATPLAVGFASALSEARAYPSAVGALTS